MPDWKKVAGTRSANAIKALELLPNTAGDGYVFDPEDVKNMFANIETALDAAKEAYAARVPDLMVRAEQESPEFPVKTPKNGLDTLPGTSHTKATSTAGPFTFPHRASISDFVANIDAADMPVYALHLSNRIYEDSILE